MPVLIEAQPLPGAEQQAPVGHGDGEAADRARVGGHVVRAFGVVRVFLVAIGRKAGQDGLQVAAHVGVGVLAEDERGAGVLQEDRENLGLRLEP